MPSLQLAYGFLIAAIVIGFEWKQLRKKQRKEKTWVAIFSLAAATLYSLIVFYPELPGLNEAVSTVLIPVSSWLGLE
ncbi:hypothetical protein [Paenibacillus campinasensis]|uniref:Uncharacterized protein n=1 Tax=Paenibacillus campinasensis TaxID=66347 RepID=A0A268ESQ2_9BACL|nr:hypothetical protein [Paenibacillus campinasensis]PAD76152.1 hypothetical protein CHH67_12945 [Paenibacillus campinasensis]